MIGVRRRTGIARAAIAVALAIALFGPGQLVSPSPGGDDGSRSTPAPPTLLMVNVNETTCAVVMDDGTVVTGTAGGGIAEWTGSGILSRVVTTAEGLPTNHITGLALLVQDPWAITRTTEPMLLARDPDTTNWEIGPVVPGAVGPLEWLKGGQRLVVLDSLGAVFLSDDGIEWVRADLPYGVPDDGWERADVDGDTLALANGTRIVIVDILAKSSTNITSLPVEDLDLDGVKLAIASFDFGDVYDLTAQNWLENSLTVAIAKEGTGYSQVELRSGNLTMATSDGTVVTVDPDVPGPENAITVLGSLPEDQDSDVTDMVLLDNETALLATMNGSWVVGNGEARPFSTSAISMPASNDIKSVGFEADILWTLTTHGLSFLNFDTRGLPTGWSDGPDLGEGVAMGTLDTALFESRVFICGYGPGIHTYDTFVSSSSSRWDRTHLYGDARDTVNDIMVVDSVLYSGGPFGIDRMVPGSDPPEFEMVPDSPAGVLSLATNGADLLVGTERGLWRFNPSFSEWESPEDFEPSLPLGPVADVILKGFEIYTVINGSVYTGNFLFESDGNQSDGDGNVTRLANRSDVDDPVWFISEGRAYALFWVEGPSFDQPNFYLQAVEQQRDELGDTDVTDLLITPDGMVYLASDSGIQRVGRYGTTWTEWTTSNGLSANDIRDLSYVELSGDLWVGAYGGVDILDVPTGDTTRIGTENGIPSNLVYDFEMVGMDVWIGTDVGGAAMANRGVLDWQAYNMSTGLIADDVQAVAVWDDHVLFGTDEGVTVLNNLDSTIDSYTSTSSDLPDNWVWCALAHHTGIYVGTASGLARFEPSSGNWTEYPIEGIEGQPVRSLEMTITGNLWVGANDGLYVLFNPVNETSNSVVRIDRSDGLPGDEVLSLKEDSEGTMWVGTSAGAAIVTYGSGFPSVSLGVQATFTTHDGLVHDRVTAIEEGPEGTIWLGTAGGLSRLTKTSWELQPQWTETFDDIPDVYIALDNIIIDPEEPNEGDLVNFTVTVNNPSGKRAIVHVGLYEDDGGDPGAEISTGIAYTEPGGSFEVTLTWTAVGGEQNLWVVADPANVVPESNERNNVVAINVHINHLPEILDVQVSRPIGNGDLPEPTVMVQFNFTYRDRDGDHPTCATVRVSGSADHTAITLRGGNPIDGIFLWGYIDVPMGDSTFIVQVHDGRVSSNASHDVRANFAVTVEGLDRGRGDDGRIRFTVSVVGPWEGTVISGVEVALVEPGTDPYDPEDWDVGLFHSASRDGEGWEYLAARQEPGTYDVWVLAMDDRMIQALFVEEGIVIEDTSSDSEVPSYLWILGGVIIISLVAVIVASLFWRNDE
jgi:ligand-binding sensor domain-containing protein